MKSIEEDPFIVSHPFTVKRLSFEAVLEKTVRILILKKIHSLF